MTLATEIHAWFRRQPGSDQIASEFAIRRLQSWLWTHCPTRILEVGAGIGTLSAAISDYLLVLDAEAVSVEDDPWCRAQWERNLSWWGQRPVLFDKVPNEFYDLVVLDGGQMPPDGWACLAPRATVFVEGNRRPQRARLRQYLRNVGRPFCETPERPRDRSKGVWLIQCEPSARERVAFSVNRLWQRGLDVPARLRGRPIGKRLASATLAALLFGGILATSYGCALAPLVLEKVVMAGAGLWGLQQHFEQQKKLDDLQAQMNHAPSDAEMPP